jgi:hypothetical protein
MYFNEPHFTLRLKTQEVFGDKTRKVFETFWVLSFSLT